MENSSMLRCLDVDVFFYAVSCSWFGFVMLHIMVYAANIYYWRRYRINYSKIFGFKQGTELGHRQVLLVAFSIGVFALLCVLANLDMEVDPETKDYQAFTELLPLFLLIVSSKIQGIRVFSFVIKKISH